MNKEQTPHHCKTDISGSINVTASINERYRQIHSNSKWFDNSEYFTIKDDGECLTIKKCGLQIPKNAKKFTTSRHFNYISELPLGRFEFDIDESSEDELVIYYR
jgi:hypothetical protein